MSARSKMLAAGSQGRVTIFAASMADYNADGRLIPHRVEGRVESSRGNGMFYIVDGYIEAGVVTDWSCTCKAGRDCVHVAAVRNVTDHRIGAAK